MGYRHIENLYRNKQILLFKHCYALEKVHGTSTHVSYDATLDKLKFFSGGAKYDLFVSIFNQEDLLERFRKNAVEHPDKKVITIYGEGYGGKMQGMSNVYGKELKFIAFEVKIDDMWLSVPQACSFAQKMGLEFVPFCEISCTQESINEQRDADSIVAIRRGMGPGHMREGVVLRPTIELVNQNGGRIMAKHKRPEFSERKTTPKIEDPGELKILEEANEIAEEWVTAGRMNNILSRWQEEDIKIENTGKFIKIMIEDVEREAEGEIVVTKAAKTAISKKAAFLFKRYLFNR